MPSVSSPRKKLALPVLQNRQSSTSQDSRASQADERASAILHGHLRSQGGNGANKTSQKQPDHKATANQQTLPPHHKNQPSQRNQHLLQRHFRDHSDRGRKRKAEEQLNQHGARKRATPQLKDEAYMRKNLRIPTSQEYPGLPSDFFKNVKVSVFNAVQGLAELKSEFKNFAADAHECTLRFKSAARDEVVVGEGRTHVQQPHFIVPIDLTSRRKLLRSLLTST